MIKSTSIYLFLLAILFGCSSDESTCPDTNCSDYTTQQEAQAAFNANPECHKDLDRDNDGIACE